MLELFVVGTFWFWALVLAEILLLFVFVEYENGIGASISVLAFGALLQWFGNVDVIGYIAAHPVAILSLAGAYFAIGAVWGIVKWWIFCRDRLEDYEEAKVEFLKRKNLPASTKVVPVEFREEWKRELQPSYSRRTDLSEPPQAKTHKAQIMRWMTFWVVSIIWSFINDFVKRVFRTIYQKMAGFLQRISDNMFGSVRDDLEIPPTDQ